MEMPPPGIAPGLPAPQAGVLLLYYSGRRLEYLGFDPSTSCLLSTHASDCANTPGAPARRSCLAAKAGGRLAALAVLASLRHLGRVVKAID